MDENELKVISEISKNSSASQRELSKILNLSLGMVNILLHRCIGKGYMKIKQLDGRNVQYMLTPKGFSEKMRRSRQYIQSTVSKLLQMKEAMKSEINAKYSKGKKKFAVVGSGELFHIVEIALKESKEAKEDISFYHVPPEVVISPDDGVVFLCADSGITKKISAGVDFIDIPLLLAQKLV